MEAAARCAQHAGNSHTALWLSGSFREADYTSRRAEQRVVIKLVMRWTLAFTPPPPGANMKEELRHQHDCPGASPVKRPPCPYLSLWLSGGSHIPPSWVVCRAPCWVTLGNFTPGLGGWVHDSEFTPAIWCQEALGEKKQLRQKSTYFATLWWLSLSQRGRLWFIGSSHSFSLLYLGYLLDWRRQGCFLTMPEFANTLSMCTHRMR